MRLPVISGLPESTPKTLGEKNKHSSSGWAVTMRRFFACRSAGGNSLGSFPMISASNIWSNSGTISTTGSTRVSRRRRTPRARITDTRWESAARGEPIFGGGRGCGIPFLSQRDCTGIRCRGCSLAALFLRPRCLASGLLRSVQAMASHVE